MRRRTLLKLILASSVPLSLNAAITAVRAAEKTLEAKNTPDPCPVNKPRRGHVEKYPYVWYYRTEVRNHLLTEIDFIGADFGPCRFYASPYDYLVSREEIREVPD